MVYTPADRPVRVVADGVTLREYSLEAS